MNPPFASCPLHLPVKFSVQCPSCWLSSYIINAFDVDFSLVGSVFPTVRNVESMACVSSIHMNAKTSEFKDISLAHQRH